jgi:hypothetical protein
MDVSRRNFLLLGQSLLAATVLPTKLLAAGRPPSTKAANLATMTIANFKAVINSSFGVGSGSSPTAYLRLLSVDSMNSKAILKSSHPAPTVDTFALHFQGTGETLAQGTYEFDHPVLGRFSLFVVPSGVTTYVAIVSRITTPLAVAPPANPKLSKGRPVSAPTL